MKLNIIIALITTIVSQAIEKVIEKKFDFLRNLRMKNVNRQIIGNLNIYSISNKFD